MANDRDRENKRIDDLLGGGSGSSQPMNVSEQTDAMLREIEERRARRAARQRELAEQVRAEEEAAKRRRERAQELAGKVGGDASEPKPGVVNSKDVRMPRVQNAKPETGSIPIIRQEVSGGADMSGAAAGGNTAAGRPAPKPRAKVKASDTARIPKVNEAELKRTVDAERSARAARAAGEHKRAASSEIGRGESADRRERRDRKSNNGGRKDMRKEKVNWVKELRDWVIAIAIAVIVALLIRNFVFTLVTVEGRSMEPSLSSGDRLYVNRFFYSPQKGDVVIFRPASDPDRPYVKRVIATEGDTIYIDFETGDVYVNDEIIDEPYINNPTTRTGSYIMELIANGQYSRENPIVIEEGHMFVMGDNRNNSTDSRIIGQIPEDEIIGGAVFRFWPLNKFGSVSYDEAALILDDETKTALEDAAQDESRFM